MFTNKQIMKMPRLNLTEQEFLRNVERLGDKINRRALRKMMDGEFLGIWKKPNGKYYRMHLKKLWFKYFNLQYPTANRGGKKVAIGREMLISSVPLPKGPIIKYGKEKYGNRSS